MLWTWLSKIFNSEVATTAGSNMGEGAKVAGDASEAANMAQSASNAAGTVQGAEGGFDATAATDAVKNEAANLADSEPWWKTQLQSEAKGAARAQLNGPGPQQPQQLQTPESRQQARQSYNQPIGRGKVTAMPRSAYDTLGQRFNPNQRFF